MNMSGVKHRYFSYEFRPRSFLHSGLIALATVLRALRGLAGAENRRLTLVGSAVIGTMPASDA